MTKMIMLRNPNDDMQDKLNKFWTSLSAWMDQQEVIEKYFRGEYTEYDNGWNGGTFYLNIDYEQEYKIQYGESYPEFAIGNRGINIDEIKDFVEIMYERWIRADMHYSFTVEINKRFDKFQLPYKLSSGSVIGKGYKTTESIEVDKLPTQEECAQVAEIFKQISDGTRLRILWLLCHCEECVSNIAAAMEMSDPAVSHHLKLLRGSGLIVSRREGKEVYYKLADTAQAQLLHHVCEEMFQISCPLK